MLNSGCFSIAEVSVASMPLWCEQRSDVRSTRRCISHKQIGKLGHNADFEVIYFDTHACAYAIWQASRSPAALINGETHTQVRRRGFSTTPRQRAALVLKRARN
jgi:hypothetical protein